MRFENSCFSIVEKYSQTNSSLFFSNTLIIDTGTSRNHFVLGQRMFNIRILAISVLIYE